MDVGVKISLRCTNCIEITEDAMEENSKVKISKSFIKERLLKNKSYLVCENHKLFLNT